MRVLKVFAAIILGIILFASEAATMGLFAVDRAFSEDTIKASIEENGSIGEVISDQLTGNNVSGGAVEAVLKTDAVDRFMSDYMTSAIHSQMSSEQYEGVTSSEVSDAFSSGIDEARSDGSINMSDMESDIMKQVISQNSDTLAGILNNEATQYNIFDNLDSESLTGRLASFVVPDDSSGFLTNDVLRIVLLALSILLCLILILMFWASKGGFIWCMIITGIVSAIYGVLSLAVAPIVETLGYSGDYVQMLIDMVETGVRTVAFVGLAVTAAFLIAFIIARATSRRRI